ncbi:hypothetical protein AB8880_08945 [Alphaproteobacteria bacterium LSUCC0684]
MDDLTRFLAEQGIPEQEMIDKMKDKKTHPHHQAREHDGTIYRESGN